MRPIVHSPVAFVLLLILGVFATAVDVSSTPAAAAANVLRALRACPTGECRSGSAPYGNLLRDSAGNLYGTTSEGGLHGGGTVFELSPDGNGGYAYQTLYNFCSEENCADGRTPHGTLIIDAQGNLYGTTLYGGEEEGGLGVAFRLEQTARPRAGSPMRAPQPARHMTVPRRFTAPRWKAEKAKQESSSS